MAGQYLILTNSEDEQFGHAPFIKPHMAGRELIVIDPVPDIIGDRALTYEITSSGPAYFYQGRPLDKVVSVWDRRPTTIRADMLGDVHKDYRTYAQDAIRMHAIQTYGWFQDSLWVSDHYAVKKAELKSYQLTVARQVGFTVPDTLFTSDPQAAAAFVASHPATIVKPTGYENPTFDDALLLFFSSKVTPEKKMDYRNLRYGPVIFQRAVDPLCDVRITVIGDQVFAAAIVADIEQDTQKLGVRDWRIGYHGGKLDIRTFDKELPKQTKQQCLALVKKLGLQFGAIDMIQDKQGKLWFIEINPAGQWAFVEEATGQPLGKAMANLLISGEGL